MDAETKEEILMFLGRVVMSHEEALASDVGNARTCHDKHTPSLWARMRACVL